MSNIFDKYKYKTRFECSATIISAEESNVSLASSLDPLLSIFPKDINIKDNPDLLYFVANGAVANLANKNADVVNGADVVRIAPLLDRKYLTIEHQRNKGAVGSIVSSGFSKYGTNEIISAEEAALLKTPFNWAVIGLVWETLNPGLVNYLLECGQEGTKNSFAASLSWELFFSDYQLLVGSSDISEGQIVSDPEQVSKLEKYLKSNGGDGIIKETKEPIYRLIVGDMLPGGFSITNSPAASVRGILPITADNEVVSPIAAESINLNNNINNINVVAEEIIQENIISVAKIEENKNNLQKNKKNISIEEKNSVNNITKDTDLKKQKKNIYMKFKSKNDITADKFTALASDQAAFVAEQINEFCDKFAADLDAKKLEIETAKANEKELKASVEKANKLVADMQAKLDASELARASEKEKNDLSLRLNDLNTRFELSDKGSQAIAKQIKGLDEDKYSEWLEFAESTFAAKKADPKKAKKVKDAADDKDDSDDDDDMDDSKADYDDAEAAKKAKAKKAAKDAKASEDDFDFESVEAKKGQKVLNNTSKDRNLAKDFADAFASCGKELGFEE